MQLPPAHLDLDRARHLVVTWADGGTSTFPVALLRRMSPSADARELRKELASNPLAVLPSGGRGGAGEPLRIESADMVGNYAIRFVFSDGHSTGIYSWDYLRSIDPDRPAPETGSDPARATDR